MEVDLIDSNVFGISYSAVMVCPFGYGDCEGHPAPALSHKFSYTPNLHITGHVGHLTVTRGGLSCEQQHTIPIASGTKCSQ